MINKNTDKLTSLLSLYGLSIGIGLLQISNLQNFINEKNIDINIKDNLIYEYVLDFRNNIEDLKLKIDNFNLRKINYTEENKYENHNSNNESNLNDFNNKQVENNEQGEFSIVNKKLDKCIENCKILTIGDSMMGDVFYSMNRSIKKQKPSWTIVNAHKVSSGLTNKDFYNWPEVLSSLLKEHHPDYVVILIGMNDAQNIKLENKAVLFGKESWLKEYKERATNIVKQVKSENAEIKWIGLPIVGKSGFEEKLKVIRNIHKDVAQENYIDSNDFLPDITKENFKEFRQSDEIHLNAKGASAIVDHIWNKF